MNKLWLLNKTNREFIDYLSRAVDIFPITAQILINRNIKTPQEVKDFFYSDIHSLTDPMEIPGMEVAVNRINTAIQGNERILIHGDYDADGITATSILLETIKKLGGDAYYFIPSRLGVGYGFHESAIEMASKSNIGLIITVDCGITSYSEVELAKSKQIDVIVTDHHEPQRKSEMQNSEFNPVSLDLHPEFLLPRAYSIINPKIQNPDTSIAQLSGAGIALLLSLALLSDDRESITESLDIAALGIIADIVPLLEINRIIVKEGTKILTNSNRPGINALIDTTGINRSNITSDLLSFTIIPRINAAGRMSDATDVVRLFVTDSTKEAERIALWLNDLNSQRQKIEGTIFNAALKKIEQQGFEKVIVIADEDWHEGVIGIVASRLVEMFNLPTFIFNIKDGIAIGSARSIPSYDIRNGIAYCSDMLIQFGGHKQAAGLRLYADNLSDFTSSINDHIKNNTKDDDFISIITIDSEVQLKDINFKLVNELSRIQPYGYGNKEPVLATKGLRTLYPRIVGNNHLKLRLEHNGRFIDSIGFKQGDLLSMVSSSGTIDAAYTPTINEWNSNKSIQLKIKALREAA